jgi:hypothetical protein
MPEGPPLPLPDDILEAKVLELGIRMEDGGADVAAIREMLLPIYQLSVLTGYSISSLYRLCDTGKIASEMQPASCSMGPKEVVCSTVQRIEEYRNSYGTPSDWGKKSAAVRWGKRDA